MQRFFFGEATALWIQLYMYMSKPLVGDDGELVKDGTN